MTAATRTTKLQIETESIMARIEPAADGSRRYFLSIVYQGWFRGDSLYTACVDARAKGNAMVYMIEQPADAPTPIVHNDAGIEHSGSMTLLAKVTDRKFSWEV